MVLYYPIPHLKERDPSTTILNIASFSGSYITPPQRGRGETPDCPSFIQLLGGPGLPLLNAADFLGLSLPHPRGEEERPWTPTILNPASLLELFIPLSSRGEKERPQSAYPKLTTQPHTHGPLLPHPRGEEEKPWTPLSKIQLHS